MGGSAPGPGTVRHVVSTLCPPRATAPYPACVAGGALPRLHVLRPRIVIRSTEPDLAACLDAETRPRPAVRVPGFPSISVVDEGMYTLSARYADALRTYPALVANASAADLTLLAYPLMLVKYCVHARGVPWGQAAASVGRGVAALGGSLGFDGVAVTRPGLPTVHVITLMGRLFMNGPQAGDPFAALDGWLERLESQHRAAGGPPLEPRATTRGGRPVFVMWRWGGCARARAVGGTAAVRDAGGAVAVRRPRGPTQGRFQAVATLQRVPPRCSVALVWKRR